MILKAVNQEKPEDINKVISDIIVNNLNLVDLRTRINMFLNDGSFSQLLDNLNPLSILINTRKVSLLYRGLLSKRTATNEIRSLNPYLHGRTCPITTSESAVIGLVKHLSLGVIINEQEEFLIPYYKVKNGKLLTNQIYKLNFYDEQDKNITD